MKVIFNILSVYLFCLALVPCGEGGGGLLKIANFLTGTEIFHLDHEEDSCEDEACSPFCICSCCISVLNSPENPLILGKEYKAPQAIIHSLDSQIPPKSFSKDIWKPPKMKS